MSARVAGYRSRAVVPGAVTRRPQDASAELVGLALIGRYLDRVP